MKTHLHANLRLVKPLAILLLLCFSFYLNGQSTDLVIIGKSFSNPISLKASLPVDVITMEVSYSNELLSNLKQALEDYPSLKNIHLFSETGTHSLQLGSDDFDVTDLNVSSSFFNDLENVKNNGINFFVYSCSLAGNEDGKTFLSELSNKTGFNVLSTANCNSVGGEDYVFDFSTSGNLITTTSISH